MQTLFCPKCGAKNSYSGAKPKFCSSCGAPVGESSDSNGRVLGKAKRKPIGEDETDIDYVPKIKSLDYEISNDGTLGCQVHKITDLINARPAEEAKSQEEDGK
jgi:ribosomal protein L37E